MLYDEILTKAGTALLRTFCRFPYRGFYPSNLAKESKVSVTHTNRILKILSENNIVSIRKVGRHDIYKLNLESRLSRELLALFHLERRLEIDPEFRVGLEEFVRKLKRSLGNHLKSIILFGSVAKGEQRKESDIDIVIITDNFKQAKKVVDKLFKELAGLYTYLIEEHLYTEEDFDMAYKLGNDLIINVLKDGIILHDTGFIPKYLKKLPTPTREHIEKILNSARESLHEADELSKRSPQSAISSIRSMVRDSCRIILLLNGIIPGSKHNLPKQIEQINPKHAKLLREINKLYHEYMEEGKRIDRETIVDYIIKSENLLKYALRLFETK